MASTYSFTTRTLLLAGLLAALFVNSSFAHTYLSSVYLNGVALSEGDCVRPHPAQDKEYPILLVTDPDMTCGWLPSAANPANRKCPISAGSTIGIQWHHNSNGPSDDILDPTHKGPIQYFLANSESGSGNVWFKIFEDGYTASDGKWATDRMIANGGLMNVVIPFDIAPGNYLLRGEILALHNAYAVNGIQPYVGCVELTITGSGSANPPGVAFPGYYTPTGPGMLFDVYSPYSSYTIPGPPLYVSGTTSTNPTTKPTSAPTTTPTTPTTKPSSAPTTAPTTVPTSAPTSGTVKVQLHGGSSAWWLGVIVYGGSETVVKVEITDSGSVSSWTTLVDMSYAFVYSGAQLTLPISVRITSASGKQITATNVFTAFSTNLIDTGKTFSSTTTPTNAPTTTPRPSNPTTAPTNTPRPSNPTTAPTNAPTSAPSGTTKITLLDGVSQWWFAVAVSGNSGAISKVELKDSDTLSSYVSMMSNTWGWAYSTQGSPLATPLTVRVTSTSGKTVTATVASITPESVIATNGSL